ncbi:hypothetical protein NIA10_06840 [Agathobaculum butyriciproducens]|nr:hypothetical protein [Agathobaculum butyriciproducens]
MMYDVALRIAKNPEIAEDIVSDTFFSADNENQYRDGA